MDKSKNAPNPLTLLQEKFFAQRSDKSIFYKAQSQAFEYMDQVNQRPVFPDPRALEGLAAFDEELPGAMAHPREILDLLHGQGSPATVAQTGGRYFGFVNGNALPVAQAAKWLADIWDQNPALYVISPVAAKLEQVCESWLKELLGLPGTTKAGFVGGTSTATLCGLAAGREHLLSKM
ncbi:MAG: pyridoxal-dependent decarboxylase, partial [Desulfobacterales bacterium]|nr:pyridoxal-dependent decarboxylase [Desulfobacterales bacterium]